MSDTIPVYCRQCNEPLDVYQPFEDRFCCEECAAQYLDDHYEEDRTRALSSIGWFG